MKHDVVVLQLNSEGQSFLNVSPQEPGYGYIAVWTSVYKRPTYLCQREQEVWFIQFDSQEFADEWFREHSNWGRITRLDTSEVPGKGLLHRVLEYLLDEYSDGTPADPRPKWGDCELLDKLYSDVLRALGE